MIKRIIRFIKNIIKTEIQGFYYLFLIISRGFFLIVKLPFILINKLFSSKKINSIVNNIEKVQENPVVVLLITIIFSSFLLYNIYLYAPEEEVIKIDDSSTVEMKKDEEDNINKEQENKEEYNLYRKFSSYKMSDINFTELKKVNSDVVAWIIVDGTNINYPIVQTSDNDYYLDHDINKTSTINGWTFMDYRNSQDISDDNTLFYGHNLFNKTAFGSLSNLFGNNWFESSNHKIIVLTENNKYTYEIFSIYYSEADSSYLRTNYSYRENYQEFLDNIKNKSEKSFSVDVTSEDKIITLSTCTDDNNGRKVVHAKLISIE